MLFGDIVALAKQGYTPQDIKDLMALSDESGKEGEQKTAEDDQQHEDPEPEKLPEDNAEDLDYKTMYEAEAEKAAKLQKMVLSADMSAKDDNRSDADIFADVMKSFM